MKSIKRLAAVILFSTFWHTAYTQTATLRVSVYDKNTGEAPIGATVVIAGTTQGSTTDLDGKTSINNLYPGKYNIEVSYIGYQKTIVEGVEIIADQVKLIKVGIVEEATILDDQVVVTAKAIRSNESALLTIQRKSAKLLDAISSEQFSRNGDNSAASALKRVTGVTVESGKYVYVRGLGDRYSKSILNGADMPSLDPDRNAVQLDLFPANLIDNIIVYKTFSPDLIGEFTGGLVNITTKDFPDAFTVRISGSLGFNTQASFNNNFITYAGSNTDWLGFDNGMRQLPSIANRTNQNNFPIPFASQADNQRLVDITRSFGVPQFQAVQQAPFLNRSLSFSVGNQKIIFNKALGFVAGFTYNRNFNSYDDGRIFEVERSKLSDPNLQDLQNSRQIDLLDKRSQQNTTLGALVNTTLKLNSTHKIALNLMHNQSANKNSRFLQGQWNFIGPPNPFEIVESRVADFVERGISNLQLKGEHQMEKINNMRVDWFSTFTTSYLDQPDLRFSTNNFSVDEIETQDTTFRASNLQQPGRYYRKMTETNSDNKLSVTIPLTFIKDYESKLKTGLAYTFRNRDFSERRYEYRLDLDGVVYDGSIPNLFAPERLASLNTANQVEGHYIQDRTLPSNTYDANQQIYAAYVMLETSLNDKLKLMTGLRFERSDLKVNFVNSINQPESNRLENNDLLPAFNLTYTLRKNANLRFAYGRTIARPTFREFAPIRTFDFYGGPVQLGNPNLNRTAIHNFDIRAEVYPRPGEYMGFGIFYKDFSNVIINTQNPGAGGNTIERQYENVSQATALGLELEFRKNLGPLLRYFKIGINTSFIYSRVPLEADEAATLNFSDSTIGNSRPMFGQSPFIINANLIYDNPDNGLSVNLVFNVFGARLKLIETALLVFEKPRPDLNFSIKKKIGKRLSLRARFNNLLNPAYEQRFTFREQNYAYRSYTRGRTFSLGLSYLIE